MANQDDDSEGLDKSALRVRFRRERDNFVATLSPAIRGLAFSRPPSPLASLFSASRCVAAYHPIGSEADPLRLLAMAAENGCRTALPYLAHRAAPMQFLSWQPGEALIEGLFGLSQPDPANEALAPDLVLLPLVAFDRAGNRLGQGAGHYDRALSLLSDANCVGVAWSVQEASELPADPWDQPLDAIVTEREWIVT